MLRLIFPFSFHFLLPLLQYCYGPSSLTYAYQLRFPAQNLPMPSSTFFESRLPSTLDTTDCALILRTVL